VLLEWLGGLDAEPDGPADDEAERTELRSLDEVGTPETVEGATELSERSELLEWAAATPRRAVRRRVALNCIVE